MGRWRVTIAGTMGLVALTAVGIASMKNPTALAASGAYTLAVGATFAATVASLSMPGRWRAIWGGFAVCCGGYLILGLSPWHDWQPGPHLLTTPLIEVVDQWISGQPAGDFMTAMNGGHRMTLTSPTRYWVAQQGLVNQDWGSSSRMLWTTLRIVHSFLALAAGTAGGLFAAVLTREARTTARPDDTPSTPSLTDHP